MVAKRLLPVIQTTTRYALRRPWLGPLAWPLVRRIRRWFGRNDRYGRLQTTFDGDLRLWVALSDHIEAQIFWQGFQEGDRGELELLKSLLEPQHIVLDIGANIGVVSLVAGKRVSHGHVYAFEPSAYHLQKLSENLRLNGLATITIIPVALSNRRSTGRLVVPPARQGALLNTGRATLYGAGEAAQAHAVETVEILPLDDFVAERNLARVDVIKIDVEGAELDVLEGGQRCIERFRPLVLMEVDLELLRRAGRSSDDLFAFWRRCDYDLFVIDNNGPLTPLASPYELRPHQNIFCRPRSGARP